MPQKKELANRLLQIRDRFLELASQSLSDEEGDRRVQIYADRAARVVKQCDDAGVPILAENRRAVEEFIAKHEIACEKSRNGDELTEDEEEIIYLGELNPVDSLAWKWQSESEMDHDAHDSWCGSWLDICRLFSVELGPLVGGFRFDSNLNTEIRPEDWQQRAFDYAEVCQLIVDRFLSAEDQSGPRPDDKLHTDTDGQDAHPPTITEDRPVVNEGTFCIVWKGNTCKLGNTQPFRLFKALYEKRNRFVSYNELIDSAWGGDKVSDNNIQKTASTLRNRLAKADMEELEIRPEPGHYGLFLP